MSLAESSIGQMFRQRRTALTLSVLGVVAVGMTACVSDQKANEPIHLDAPFHSVAALKENDGRKSCAELDGQRIRTEGILSISNPRYLGNPSLEDPNENSFPGSRAGKIAIEVGLPDASVFKALKASAGQQVVVEGQVVFYNVNPTSNDCWLNDAVILGYAPIPTQSK